ncbi:cytochrome P450 [Lactarius tabidus]
MASQTISLLALTTVLAFLAHAYYRWRNDSLRKLRGPGSSSFLYGNELDVRYQKEVGDCEFKWARKYGNVWRQQGSLGKGRLVVADPTALRYILHVPGNHFGKPMDGQKVVEMTYGKGLVWAPSGIYQGEVHQRQREIMNPAFSAPQIRALLPVFQNSASKLALASSLDPSMVTTIRVAPSRYAIVFRTLWYYIPEVLMDLLRYLPTPRFRQFRNYSAFMHNFSRGVIEKSIVEGDGKDVMSVLLRANASEDPRARLSDIEMVDQIATLLFAGHDTTTNTLSWCLYGIARDPKCQERVRSEIAAMRMKKGGQILSATDLDTMTYTLATLKESLRLHLVVHTMAREATQDNVIPLSSPIVTKSGEQVSSIHVRKRTPIDVAIAVYNRLPEI